MAKTKTPNFTQDQILTALNHLEDFFGLVGIRFFLLDKTLKEVQASLKHNHHLSTPIVIGFEKRLIEEPGKMKEWNYQAAHNLYSIEVDEMEFLDDCIQFSISSMPVGAIPGYKKVPVICHLITDKKVTPYLKHPDMIIYKYGVFNLPNPWKKYLKEVGLI